MLRTTARRTAVAAVLALLTAGCGSTVQVRSGAAPLGAEQAGGDGLSLPTGAPLPGETAPGGGPALPPGSVVAPDGSTVVPPGSPGSPGGPGAPAPGTSAAPRQPASRGGTQTGPIPVGILYTNNEQAASQAGVDNGNSFSSRKVYEGFVAATNARGGFAGRRIRPVYVALSSSSSSYAADLQAACARFTEDAKVSVVISSLGLFTEAFSRCLSSAGVPQVAADYATGDAQSLRQVPTLVAPSTLTADDKMRLLLEGMTAAGRLTRQDRLGVVVEGCEYNVRAQANSVVPTARRLGLTIEETVESRCFTGINELGGLAADMQNAVLRFQTNGVTKVLFVSGSVEANLLLFFANAAEAQGYRPGYALTSAAIPSVQESNSPRNQLVNAFGLGWLPSLDTNRTPSSRPPVERQCLQDLQKGAGVSPQSAADRYYAFSVCDAFRLYDAALRLTRGASQAGQVMSAISSLGTSFPASALVGNSTDFRGGRRTAPGQGRVFAWSTACTCFDYAGRPFALTGR